MKRNRYEIEARAALLALQHGVAKNSHLVDLFVLSELCDAMTGEAHIRQHCASVRRLCDEIHDTEYECTELRYVAMETSANLLLEWFERQPNVLIARTARQICGKLAA
jgi:hypothetical protein